MKFEEEFPSIRNVKGNMYSFISKSPEVQEAIRISCLDKQRVRNVIDKYIIEQTKGIKFGMPINPMKLKTELRLE